MSRGSSATSQQSVQEAKRDLQKVLKHMHSAPNEILQDESSRLYGEIIQEVPYKSGNLESSVRVSVSRSKRSPGINASASAKSDSGYDYAGIQHENESFEHPIKGKAHFISDPFNRMIKRIEEKMDKAFRF